MFSRSLAAPVLVFLRRMKTAQLNKPFRTINLGAHHQLGRCWCRLLQEIPHQNQSVRFEICPYVLCAGLVGAIQVQVLLQRKECALAVPLVGDE